MTCADLDILLCDYVDGTLDGGRKAEVEQHIAECASCAELLRDATGAVAFMERVAAVEPPPELMTRILFDIRGPEPVVERKQSWFRRLFGGIVEPLLQPRFVMGMAMTILSFSMLGRFAGIPVRQLKASDLEPVKIWATMEHKVNRGWLAVVKYYDSLRFVYEVQSRLTEWSEQDEELTNKDAGAKNGAQSSGGSSATAPARLIEPNDQRLREYGQPKAPGDGAGKEAKERSRQ